MSGERWLSVNEIAHVHGLLDELLDSGRDRLGVTSTNVLAAQLVDRHARVIAEAAAPIAVDGGVADLDPGRVRILVRPDGHMQRAEVDRAAAAPAGVDPVRHAVQAIVSAHEDLVAAVAARRGRAAAVLWRSVGDRIAIAFSARARETGRAGEAPAIVASVIGADARFGAPRRVGMAIVPGAQRPFLVRQGCCLSYRTVKAESCFTCPLVDDDERRARLARGDA